MTANLKFATPWKFRVAAKLLDVWEQHGPRGTVLAVFDPAEASLMREMFGATAPGAVEITDHDAVLSGEPRRDVAFLAVFPPRPSDQAVEDFAVALEGASGGVYDILRDGARQELTLGIVRRVVHRVYGDDPWPTGKVMEVKLYHDEPPPADEMPAPAVALAEAA